MKTTVFHFVYATAKKVLPISIASRLRSAGTAFITPLRFSIAKGHSRSSFLCLAVDSKGNPLPWYTYPAIDFLRVRDFSQKTVLEFGGGQSTLWWQARAKSVLTIEENDDWARMLSTKNRENARTIYIPVDRESRSVENVKKELSICGLEKFDIIVIDGHLRKELAEIAHDYLADDGAIIMDNSEG